MPSESVVRKHSDLSCAGPRRSLEPQTEHFSRSMANQWDTVRVRIPHGHTCDRPDRARVHPRPPIRVDARLFPVISGPVPRGALKPSRGNSTQHGPGAIVRADKHWHGIIQSHDQSVTRTDRRFAGDSFANCFQTCYQDSINLFRIYSLYSHGLVAVIN